MRRNARRSPRCPNRSAATRFQPHEIFRRTATNPRSSTASSRRSAASTRRCSRYDERAKQVEDALDRPARRRRRRCRPASTRIAEQLAALDGRLTAVSTELANQLSELGNDIDALQQPATRHAARRGDVDELPRHADPARRASRRATRSPSARISPASPSSCAGPSDAARRRGLTVSRRSVSGVVDSVGDRVPPAAARSTSVAVGAEQRRAPGRRARPPRRPAPGRRRGRRRGAAASSAVRSSSSASASSSAGVAVGPASRRLVRPVARSPVHRQRPRARRSAPIRRARRRRRPGCRTAHRCWRRARGTARRARRRASSSTPTRSSYVAIMNSYSVTEATVPDCPARRDVERPDPQQPAGDVDELEVAERTREPPRWFCSVISSLISGLRLASRWRSTAGRRADRVRRVDLVHGQLPVRLRIARRRHVRLQLAALVVAGERHERPQQHELASARPRRTSCSTARTARSTTPSRAAGSVRQSAVARRLLRCRSPRSPAAPRPAPGPPTTRRRARRTGPGRAGTWSTRWSGRGTDPRGSAGARAARRASSSPGVNRSGNADIHAWMIGSSVVDDVERHRAVVGVDDGLDAVADVVGVAGDPAVAGSRATSSPTASAYG